MLSRPFSYLFSISYYGARFKGWAKQQGQPTIEGKLERVFRYVLGHEDFSLIGSSRTDSGVSCRSGFVQVFLRFEMDFIPLLAEFNRNLGGDISLNDVREISRDFNLIQAVEKKTYRYIFSDDTDFHPFSSAFCTRVSHLNTLAIMQGNAGLFRGKQDFRAYSKTSPNKTDFVREVLDAEVFEINSFTPEFSPARYYCFQVTGTGFLHHQVRKMVSAIWHFSPQEIKDRLEYPTEDWAAVPTASASGLILWDTVLKGSYK